MQAFVSVAPYLSNVFVLIAFCFFTFSVILKYFFKRKLFPTLTKKASGKIVERMILFSFIITIVSIVLGFGVKILESYWQTVAVSAQPQATPKLLPFHTGWIFVGYYDFADKYYLESQYAELVYRSDKSITSPDIPVIGDVWKVKKDRNIVIYNYTTEGLKYQFTNPNDEQFLVGDAIILEDKDLTGIILPKDSLLVVRDVGFSPKLSSKKTQAVWIRIAECEAEIDACKQAAETLETTN